jgi:hypothetical protein
VAARKPAAARAAVLPAPPKPAPIRRLAPSGRSLVVGLAIVALAGGAYAVARETSVFAVSRLDVVGGPPRVQAEVRAALAGELGRSLLQVNQGEVERRIAAYPDILSVSFDRRFPHTLRVVVRAERPVLLLRRGSEGWVVSARGRVLQQVKNTRLSPLPRMWVPPTTAVSVNGMVESDSGGMAAATLASLPPSFFGRVRFVRADAKELTLVLATGLEIRFGDIHDVRLKVAVARRILTALGPTATSGYLDVSVPGWPVAKVP